MLHEVRESDLLELRAFYTDLTLVTHWEELIECSISALERMISSDCTSWDEWTPHFGEPTRLHMTTPYQQVSTNLLPQLAATIQHHPVIYRLGWENLSFTPHRLSDFETQTRFKNNPLFREFYRHIDAYHQVGYHYASTSSAELTLTINRRLADFTQREIQIFKLAADTIAPFAKALHKQEDALKKASIICDLFQECYGLNKMDSLSLGELQLLSNLADGLKISRIAKEKGIRRDTVSNQLAQVREKLVLTSNKELLSTLRLSPNFVY